MAEVSGKVLACALEFGEEEWVRSELAAASPDEVFSAISDLSKEISRIRTAYRAELNEHWKTIRG